MSQILNAQNDYRVSCRAHLSNLLEQKNHSEAIRYFESVREVLSDRTDLESGMIMRLGARAYLLSGDYSKSLPLARTAISIVSRFGDNWAELGECFLVLGNVERELGKYGEAEKAYRDAESIFRRNDDIVNAGEALNKMAGVLFRKGDPEGTLRYLLEAVELSRKVNDHRRLAYLFGNIGRVYTLMGKLSAAEENIQLNIGLSQEFDDEVELARAYLSLGYVQILQDKWVKAEESLEKGHEYIRRNSMEKEMVIYLTYRGELAMRRGNDTIARQDLEQAVAKAYKMAPDALLTARPMRHLAQLSLNNGEIKKALMTAQRALAIIEKSNSTVETGALHQIIAACRERLGEAEKAREEYQLALGVMRESRSKLDQAGCLAAMGNSVLYDTGARIRYLCRAEDLYQSCGTSSKVIEIQKKLGELEIGTVRQDGSAAAKKNNAVPFHTRNPEVIRIIAQMNLLKDADLPVLFTGETGTGKDFMARYFHSIARPDGPYVAVNCAAVPDTLIESELFGYVKGAFTGADQEKKGLFLAAHGGVILLDEVGELPLPLQAKLLRIIEFKKVRPLGASTEVSIDVKIVAATNRDLNSMVKEGTFRRDLYYRLAGVPFELPPLRERKEDIPYLLELFMRRDGLLNGSPPDPELIRQFMDYDWPGNIRQLENKVKQLAAMASLSKEGSARELTRSFFEEKQDEVSNSLFEQVERLEKRLLMEALAVSKGNKSEAARYLDIHESTFRAKMKRYGLEAMAN
ncbi:putative NtrC family transcriptional regulator [Candidatus Zixiibacteriota bacterium]|nr:putative NtrC family transcriptional regulator [candidate division Zixibacteria bacterium]